MAAKRKIEILDEEIIKHGKSLKKKKPLTKIVQTYIEEDLSDGEDKFYSKVADERLSKPHAWISHEDAWK